jgi:hypothetical protein
MDWIKVAYDWVQCRTVATTNEILGFMKDGFFLGQLSKILRRVPATEFMSVSY